jgi:hypothetical protein
MPRVATPGRVTVPTGQLGTPVSLLSLAAAFEGCKKRAGAADCLTDPLHCLRLGEGRVEQRGRCAASGLASDRTDAFVGERVTSLLIQWRLNTPNQ